uniref:Uncharacterized protein n=1 Tax=Setaria digitata TaxID=48799 RepID=A0A915Q4F1_9BILA
MSTKSLSFIETNRETFPVCTIERVSFKYVWNPKVLMRQLNDNESVILHVSPKFATVHGQVAFQWSLQMRGTTFLNDEDEVELTGEYDDETKCELNYIALSLYLNDGPAPIVNDLQATTKILQEKKSSVDSNDDAFIIAESVAKKKAYKRFMKGFVQQIKPNLLTKRLSVVRGKETELTAMQRFAFSNYIKENVGQVIHLSIMLNFPEQIFKSCSYLDILMPTPITSFLNANYRAKASSKVFNRRTRRNKLGGDMAESFQFRKLSLKHQEDFEEIFNRIMNQERELRTKARSIADFKKCEGLKAGPAYKTILFKKFLMACCDGCQKRAKIMEEKNFEMDNNKETEALTDENGFACSEQNKHDIHETIANMFFTKVALPEMHYVEDFADFLIDTELNNLPVLKRACEGYLCSELNSKKDLITSLLFDLLFLAIVFNLRVLKSMTLSELSNRPEELDEPDALLAREEYKNLDRRMMKLSGRSLTELIEEVQRFREQRLRTKPVNMN